MATVFDHHEKPAEKASETAPERTPERASKKDGEENPNQELALELGRVVFTDFIAREKRKGGGRQLQLKDLDPKEVPIGDLRQWEEVLGKTRADLEKRFEDFRETEKEILKKLKPFNGERRELLRLALADKLIPRDKDKKDEKPDDGMGDKERAEKYHEVMVEFDKKMKLDSETPVPKLIETYLAAYTTLQHERIFKTEDQLCGTREQDNRRRINVVDLTAEVAKYFGEKSNVALTFRMIVENRGMSEAEKAHSINAVIESMRDTDEGSPLHRFADAVIEHAAEGPRVEQEIAILERTMRADRESIERARQCQTISASEQMLMKLPADKGRKDTFVRGEGGDKKKA